jgi:L-ascorbate metabolism protein UlaG (beta-lactamase superfamily)
MPHLLVIPLILATLALAAAPRPAHAQAETPVSQCQMIANALPTVTFASFSTSPPLLVQAQANEEVVITYVGHSTFFIETPGGVRIATDYSGWHRPPALPTVATMNKAHSSHYTMTPDPGIAHVLRGWEDGSDKGADHDLVVGDTYIRNVATDIRSWGGAMEQNGNSIFIFEVAGLCIGHLGHLHHELTEAQYAEIGRLDILMVPVDGGLTLGADSMSRVVQRLRSSLILPMHRRGPPISQFLSMFGKDFDAVTDEDATITVSIRSLPKRPTIHILSGV